MASTRKRVIESDDDDDDDDNASPMPTQKTSKTAPKRAAVAKPNPTSGSKASKLPARSKVAAADDSVNDTEDNSEDNSEDADEDADADDDADAEAEEAAAARAALQKGKRPPRKKRATSISVEAGAGAGAGAGTGADAAVVDVAALQGMLPDDVEMSFSIFFTNPLILQGFLNTVCQMLHSDLLMYITCSSKFRGIQVDALTPSHVVMVVGRLPCDVVLYGKDETTVYVNVKAPALLKAMRSVRGYHSVVMYGTNSTECQLVIGIRDAMNLPEYKCIALMDTTVSTHDVMRPIMYTYELSVAAGEFRERIRAIKDETDGDGTVMLRLVEVTPSRRLLVFVGKHTVNMIAVASAAPLKGTTSVRPSCVADNTDRVRLERDVAQEAMPTNLSLSCIAQLKCLYSEKFSIEYLHDMVRSMATTVQLTLHLGPDKPLTMHVTLDLKETPSFVAFIVMCREDPSN